MLAERDLRKVRALKNEARVSVGQIKSLSVGPWRIGVSVLLHHDLVQWAFSAQLLDRFKSTEDDWQILGQIVGAVGAPFEPLVPIAETRPENVHHWAWVDGPDGPIPLTVETATVDAIREAVRNRPRSQ